MKKIIFLTLLLVIGLSGCNRKIDYSKFVPDDINQFATGFISEIHKGNIDSCLTLVLPEMNNDEGRQFLTNTYTNIRSFSIDSFSIINAQKSVMLGSNGYTNYRIDYEYRVENKFLYFALEIKEQDEKLTIIAFDGGLMNQPLSEIHAFTLKDKGFFHYLFLFLAILVPIFIITTLIVAIKTKLKLKWLWIIGILIGFVKFSINWTTGQIGCNVISILFLGAGFVKTGNVAPWILSFSIPIVAIIFWFKRSWDKRKAAIPKQLHEEVN